MSWQLCAPETVEDQNLLAKSLAKYAYDPLGFVLAMFPWKEPGTRLADEDGPDKWQVFALEQIGQQLREGKKVIQIAVSSGHGIGKSALIAWVIIWFNTCFAYSRSVCTANTMRQLSNKTWREVAKWHGLFKMPWMHDWTATTYRNRSAPETWFAEATPWSENNAQAFAGLHEDWVLVAYDEASEIADIIWETTEGAFTTRGLWIVFGNPSQPHGRFRQCFTRFRNRWTTLRVDAREAKKADKERIAEWIEDYGEDSDFVRVRVKGIPPRQGPKQFISEESVSNAIKRVVKSSELSPNAPLVMGVDVARQGDDASVIVFRKSRKLLPEIRRYHEPNLMKLAGYVAEAINKARPKVVFIDIVGIGAGVYDRLIQLGFDNIVAVQAGERADNQERYFNKRAEMWDRMKHWLETADIPDDKNLQEDLIGPQYDYGDNKMRLRLEKKEDMKARGLASPDCADAVSMTFAYAIPDTLDPPSLEPDTNG